MQSRKVQNSWSSNFWRSLQTKSHKKTPQHRICFSNIHDWNLELKLSFQIDVLLSPLKCKAEGEGLDNDFESLRIKTHVPVGAQLPKHFSPRELIWTRLLKIKTIWHLWYLVWLNISWLSERSGPMPLAKMTNTDCLNELYNGPQSRRTSTSN